MKCVTAEIAKPYGSNQHLKSRRLRNGIAVCGLAAVSLWSCSGSAADLPRKAPYIDAASPYNWGGLYFGAQLGGEFSARPITGTTTGLLSELGDPGALGPNTVGFAGGGHLGLNYQTGSFVLGVEGGAELSSLNSSGSVALPFNMMSMTTVVRKPWDAYAIAKAGLAFGPQGQFLFYGFGGGALAELQNDSSGSCFVQGCIGFTSTSVNNIHSGWTAGAGLDWGSGPVVLGLRYRYSDYGTHGVILNAGDVGSFRSDQSARDNQFTGRVSIKLN